MTIHLVNLDVQPVCHEEIEQGDVIGWLSAMRLSLLIEPNYPQRVNTIVLHYSFDCD